MSVVTVDEAQAHLNDPSPDEAELQAFLNRCEAALSRMIGPLAATAVTADVAGYGPVLLLPTTPAISLTSVTDSMAATLSIADLHLTTDGVVTWTVGYGSFGTFCSPRYTVVYQAGRASLPDDLKLAVLEMVRHKWETQRGPGTRVVSGDGTDYGSGTRKSLWDPYSFPPIVSELIAPHIQVGV